MNKEDLMGEEGLYQWTCKQCRKMFTPKRMLLWPDKRFQTCCDNCQADNLLRMVFHPEELENEE